MKLLLSCLTVLILTPALASAEVVNDGTTTQGLLRLAPAPSFNPDSTTTLATSDGSLLASINQQDTYGPNFPRLHTVWYGTAYVATGLTYQASAHYQAAQDTAYLDGGVVGWMDEAAGRGIVFALREDTQAYCEVAAFNFNTGASLGQALYDTNGVEMVWSQQPETARSELSGAFQAENFLRLELAFVPPTPADLEALPTASARLTATGYQDNGSGEQVVTTPVVLLTALPEPASGDRLIGYYAVYSRSANRTGPIGWLKNLVIEGEVGVGNELPAITLDSPVDGEQFGSGDPILLAATASDPAPGSVAQVEFFVETTSLQVVTQAPYTYTWTTAAIGAHALSAVATDNQGAQVRSETVSVEVTNRPPTVTVLQPSDGQNFLPGEEVVVAASPEDVDGSIVSVRLYVDDAFVTALAPPNYRYAWIPDEIRSYTVVVEAQDNLGATGASDPVTITVGQFITEPATFSRYEVDAQGQVQLEWDRLGFQVQSAASLLGPWSDVAVDTTGVRAYAEPAGDQPKYYRLAAKGGVPTQPQFTEILLEGSEIVLRWDGAGRQVQATPNLTTDFQDVATNTTGAQEYRTPANQPLQFFRLR